MSKHGLTDSMPSVYVTDPDGANRLLPLVHITQVDSTNTACMSRLREGSSGALAPVGSDGGSNGWCALWTDNQTAGRGRQGRVWHSQPGASLCLSVGRRLPAGVQAHPALTVALGAAVVRVLRSSGCGAWLKWPNDIVLAIHDKPHSLGRQADGNGHVDGAGGAQRSEEVAVDARFGKLGGILCEASSAGAGAQTLLVAGVGINLRPFDLAGETSLPRVSLQDCGAWSDTGGAANPSPDSAAASLALALAQALTDILAIANDGPALSAWCDQASQLDAWQGQTLCVHERGQIMLEGVSEGIAPDGQYRLRTPLGLELLSVGELSLRLPHSPATGVLLVDIGNTRLKWCVADAASSATFSSAFITEPEHVLSHSHADARETSQLFARMAAVIGRLRTDKTCDVTSIRLARVGPQPWLALFSRFAQVQSLGLDVIESSACHGPLRNGYDDPAQLGVDRFLGALAVVHTFSGRAAVIVSAGTATTVDAVDADGYFRGGYILPGPQMMATSLHQNTAQLPQVGPQWALFPHNTPQAIASGIVQAQAGAVRGMLSALQAQCGEEPLLVLTGGARQWLRPVFESAEERESLVLEGLAAWGRYPRL